MRLTKETLKDARSLAPGLWERDELTRMAGKLLEMAWVLDGLLPSDRSVADDLQDMDFGLPPSEQ